MAQKHGKRNELSRMPSMQKLLLPKISKDIVSFNKTKNLPESWKSTVFDNQVEFIKTDNDGQNKICVYIDENFNLAASYYGWASPSNSFLKCIDVKNNTVFQVLRYIENLKTCQGIVGDFRDTNTCYAQEHYILFPTHPMEVKDNLYAPRTYEIAYRSIECMIFLEKDGVCINCVKASEMIKNKINETEECKKRLEDETTSKLLRCHELENRVAYLKNENQVLLNISNLFKRRDVLESLQFLLQEIPKLYEVLQKTKNFCASMYDAIAALPVVQKDIFREYQSVMEMINKMKYFESLHTTKNKDETQSDTNNKTQGFIDVSNEVTSIASDIDDFGNFQESTNLEASVITLKQAILSQKIQKKNSATEKYSGILLKNKVKTENSDDCDSDQAFGTAVSNVFAISNQSQEQGSVRTIKNSSILPLVNTKEEKIDDQGSNCTYKNYVDDSTVGTLPKQSLETKSVVDDCRGFLPADDNKNINYISNSNEAQPVKTSDCATFSNMTSPPMPSLSNNTSDGNVVDKHVVDGSSLPKVSEIIRNVSLAFVKPVSGTTFRVTMKNGVMKTSSNGKLISNLKGVFGPFDLNQFTRQSPMKPQPVNKTPSKSFLNLTGQTQAKSSGRHMPIMDKEEFEKMRLPGEHLDRPYECNKCKKCFKRWYELRRHYGRHFSVRTLKCEFCPAIYKEISSFKYHMLTHTGKLPYTCKECGCKFRGSQHLTKHMKTIHSEERKSKNLQVCEYCGCKFLTLYPYLDHVKRFHHGVRKVKPFDANQKKTNSLQKNCNNKELKKNAGVALSRQYQCKICLVSAVQLKGLKVHMKKEHVKNVSEAVTCDVCIGPFTEKCIESDHQIIKKKPYQCDKCEKKLSSRLLLRIHKKRHNGDSSKDYVCDVCSKQFDYLESFRRHCRIHTGEKPFICDFCSRGFKCPTSLKFHIRTHTGERPYNCTVCSKAFVEGRGLKKHKCKGPDINNTDSSFNKMDIDSKHSVQVQNSLDQIDRKITLEVLSNCSTV